MTVRHHATITAKMPGTLSLVGTVDEHNVDGIAIVPIYRGENLPANVPRSVSKPCQLNNGGRHGANTV